MWSGCELKSASCLDCKYLKNETSPVDQANLSILRNSIKLLRDPVDSTKQFIQIDYKFQVSPFIAFRPQLSNHLLGKSTSLALYKRLKKRNLLESFHTKITEGMVAGHSTFMTPSKLAELDNLPKYYCSLNFVMKNSTLVKKLRPTSNFSLPHVSGSFNLLAVNGPNILNSVKRVLLKFFNFSTAITANISTAYRALHISKLSQSLSRFFWFSNPDAQVL